MGVLRTLRVTAMTVGTVGGLSGAMYGLLSGQGKRARSLIGRPTHDPHQADGFHPAPGVNPLKFAVLGDSVAAGLGAESTDLLPGVLLARGLAEEYGRPVRLTTYAVVGANTKTLMAQVDRAVLDPPDLVLLIIGGNDVTGKMRVRTSAALLRIQVARLRNTGARVVVGTCPDLGAIRPVPQPLRWVLRNWGRMLARAQREAVERAGGVAVPIADLVSPEFHTRYSELFSPDRFHPNGAGYRHAADILLAPLCAALR
ncbi:SGNH/GDSL hydrolase family protein [Actinocrispum wychmicini]|uniref:Lysophospholipase L1-like esterase n=1 Tax=Actinocrispum wychmicini TaxID=1213861 RepID=A0A4R2JMX4_9PSEU|nr:SGNH/GDSL hydrolase family protein [Actinocrispum wychmicini]TCO58486.1 lysophospholipase L1-like esterase [Actinocrispum wychmicini]